MPKSNLNPYNAEQRKQHPITAVPVPVPKQIPKPKK